MEGYMKKHISASHDIQIDGVFKVPYSENKIEYKGYKAKKGLTGYEYALEDAMNEMFDDDISDLGDIGDK